MSSIKQSVKKSSRFITVGLLITLISGIALASGWESVGAFVQNIGLNNKAESTSVAANPLLSGNLYRNDDFLVPGTCDTAGPIEVEGSIAGTTPTAYATLTLAFAAINAGTHTGAITIDVCGDTSEGTATAVLNASGAGSASYTSIAMSPAGGAARTISGATTAGSPMVDFNGADNVTINGLNTGGNSLTISNTTVSATSGTATFRFIGGATSNTITNSNIQGSGTMSVATNGATIFFSTDAVTANGNDNNTISNNNIGPAGANLPTKAILGNGSTTTTAIGNSGNIINNNNIFDFFGAAVTSAGVATNGGCNAWSITNNRFYQTATRTWTTGAVHTPISITPSTATSGAQGFTITGNIIGYASNTQTGTYTLSGSTGIFRGIVFTGITGGTISNINNNTIASVSLTGVTSSGTSTSSPFLAIIVTNGLANTNSNIIGSQGSTGSLTYSTTTTSSTDVYGIFNFSVDNWTANSNNIGGISVTNLGASGTFLVFGMRANTSTAATFTGTSNNVGGTVANSISLTSTGAASQVTGMLTNNAISTWTSNTVRNLTNNNGTGTTTAASVIGMSLTTTTPNQTISQNTIFNLTNTNTTLATVVTGIQFTGGAANVVERNFIYNLLAPTTSTAAEINGIRVAGGTTTYRNNMIALGANQAIAIGTVASNSSTPGINGFNGNLGTDAFVHNSVYIGGTATSGSGNSYALNGTQTTNARSFRDNIFFNARSNAGATGKNYAVKINGTAANPAGLTINNNVYFANGTGGVFGFFNSLDVANLAAWRTAVGQDAGSFESNPQYNDPTNAVPDLHIHPTNPTVVEGNGADVGVTNDFDGQTRASLTPVDIGADAGNFNGIDLAAPSISYTPFINTSSTANRILSVTITDVTGVATGGNAPRIYFNKNAGMYFSTACSLSSGTTQNGVWNCTIDNSLIGGVIATDVIRYFVVAQDTAGNLAANPSGGFSGTNVNTVTTPPTTPNQYTIVGAISGSINVGTTETYTSLTNTGGIFEAINAAEVTGNITINLTSDLTSELGTVALNEFASPFTILIKPSGAPRTITGTNTGALIRLNGADRVRIDGSTAAMVVGGNPALRELTIQNTNVGTSAAVISIGSNGTNGATNNTIQNVNVLGQDPLTTLIGISIGGATPGTPATGPNNSNRVENCTVKRSIFGIFTSGVAATPTTGTVITQNDISATTTDRVSRVGIVVFNENGIQITENSVGGLSITTSNDAIGIGVGTQAIDTTSTTSGGVSNALVSRNKINGVASLSTTGFSAAGITVAGGTLGANVIANNMITGVTAPATSPDIVAGIYVIGATGSNTKLYYNSVANTGDRGVVAGQTPSYGIAITGTDPTVELKNNIFYTTQIASGGGVDAKSYAIGMVTTTFANLDSNYNDFFSSGANAGFFRSGSLTTAAGTDYATLALWQAAVSDDANSKEIDPLFVDPLTDLHLQATSTLINMGIAAGGITVDFDGQTRPSGAAPEIGADEIVAATPGTLAFSSSTYSVGEGGGTVTLTVNRTGGSDGTVTADYALAGGTATGGAACGGAVDYVNTGGTVSFANGETTKTFTVAICDDAILEGDETFNATLSNATGGATLGSPNPATVTITDNEVAMPGSLQFSSATYTVGEAGPTATITVTRTGGTDGTVGVSYATGGGTATGGATCTTGVDYQNTSGTLSWTSGESASKTFTIPICDDSLFESPDETVNLALSNPTGGATLGTPNTATLTINENDTAPSLQFSSPTYSNNDDIAQNFGKSDEFAPQVATITVTRTGATENAVSVNYATVAGGTATGGAACAANSGVDYVTTNGTLSFASGDLVKTFNITVCSDALFEGNETVNLALSSPTPPAVLGTPNTAVLTIVDNETIPTLQFSSATYSNSDDIAAHGITTDEFAPSVATITVTRTGATENAVSVDYATMGGTATGGASCTAGVDYIITSGTLNFASGVNSQMFNITVCTDGLFEGNETVNLVLSNPQPTGQATLGTPNMAVLTIVDNDAQPSVQFSSATYSVGEAGPTATITVTRTGAPDNVVSVNYATSNGTATGGAACGGAVDYQNTSGTLNFATGVSSQTFTVAICDDALAEMSETVNLALSSPTGAVLGTPNTAVLTITDNDAAPTLQFSSATTSVGEGGGTVTLTVTRNGATGNAVTVDYSTLGGSATGGASCAAGVDFVNTSGTLNFAIGDTSKTFNVTICEDALIEGNETFTASLSNATGGATVGTPSTETVTITDNDVDNSPPTITYTPLPNTNSTANPVLSVTGMDNVGITTMTIFWSVNGGAYNSNACSLSGGTPQNGTWSCVINGVLTNPSAVAYYVTAQDAAANSTSNPSAGAAAPNLFTIGAGTVPAGTYTNASLSFGTMLGGNVTVTNNLTIAGLIYTGANTLTLDCMATVTGASANNYVIGNVRKNFCGPENFLFPIGTNPDGMLQEPDNLGFANEYSPFTANVTAGTFPSSLTVTVTDGNLAGADPAKSASRYWDVTETGVLTADISYTYLNQDVNGDENTYQVLRREGMTTAVYTPGSVNPATNTATANGVTNFSSWGAGNLVALAANASISGRILTSAGQGIRNVKVTIVGGNLPEPRVISTGSFGYYQFDDLEVGQTYIITVNSQRYVFSNPSSVVTLQEDIAEHNFTAEPF